MPDLGDEERARLLSCMEEIRNVVGESVSENRLTQTVLEHDFDCAKALDAILNLAVSSAAYPDPSPVPTTAAKPTPTKPETSKGEPKSGLEVDCHLANDLLFLFFIFHFVPPQKSIASPR